MYNLWMGSDLVLHLKRKRKTTSACCSKIHENYILAVPFFVVFHRFLSWISATQNLNTWVHSLFMVVVPLHHSHQHFSLTKVEILYLACDTDILFEILQESTLSSFPLTLCAQLQGHFAVVHMKTDTTRGTWAGSLAWSGLVVWPPFLASRNILPLLLPHVFIFVSFASRRLHQRRRKRNARCRGHALQQKRNCALVRQNTSQVFHLIR